MTFKSTNAAQITIPTAQYETLMRDQDKLCALYAYGVDNWDGYSEAMASLDTEDEDERT